MFDGAKVLLGCRPIRPRRLKREVKRTGINYISWTLAIELFVLEIRVISAYSPRLLMPGHL